MRQTNSDLVILEIMPAWLRAHHTEARNAGSCPHNGAQRFVATRADAEAAVTANGHWARIVRVASAEDAAAHEPYTNDMEM